MKLPIDALKSYEEHKLPYTEENEVITADPSYSITGFSDYSSIEYIESDQKEKIQFIRYIESLSRHSMELKQYITFLKENLDMTKCAILNNVDAESATIELHHFPFTLFDIVRIVVDKAIYYKSDITSFDLVSEVVRLHYEGLVGLVPLSATAHELAHSGKIILSLRSVHGKWDKFVEQYRQFISEEDISRLKFLIRSSSNSNITTENRRKLKIKRRLVEYNKQETGELNVENNQEL